MNLRTNYPVIKLGPRGAQTASHQVGTRGAQTGGQLAYQLWQPELQNVKNNKNLQTNSGLPEKTQSCEMSKNHPNQTQTQSEKCKKRKENKLLKNSGCHLDQDVTGLVDISKHLKSPLVP